MTDDVKVITSQLSELSANVNGVEGVRMFQAFENIFAETPKIASMVSLRFCARVLKADLYCGPWY